MNIRKLSSVLVFFLLFSIFACGNGQDEAENSEGTYPEGSILSIFWDTSGGGEIKFTVEKANDDFEITVESIDQEPVDLTIVLTEEDQQVYTLVEDIFEERINLYDYTFTPMGETGTWTTISLLFTGDITLDIKDIDPNSELHILRDYVEENSAIDE